MNEKKQYPIAKLETDVLWPNVKYLHLKYFTVKMINDGFLSFQWKNEIGLACETLCRYFSARWEEDNLYIKFITRDSWGSRIEITWYEPTHIYELIKLIATFEHIRLPVPEYLKS